MLINFLKPAYSILELGFQLKKKKGKNFQTESPRTY